MKDNGIVSWDPEMVFRLYFKRDSVSSGAPAVTAGAEAAAVVALGAAAPRRPNMAGGPAAGAAGGALAAGLKEKVVPAHVKVVQRLSCKSNMGDGMPQWAAACEKAVPAGLNR